MDHDEPDQSYHAPPESKPRVRLISHEERLAILAAFGIHPGTPPTVQTHYVALAFPVRDETEHARERSESCGGNSFPTIRGGSRHGRDQERGLLARPAFGLPRRSKY